MRPDSNSAGQGNELPELWSSELDEHPQRTSGEIFHENGPQQGHRYLGFPTRAAQDDGINSTSGAIEAVRT